MRIDLTDETLFATNAFEPVFAWLRANDPVHRHEVPGGDGFWVLSRHADIAAVYSNAEVFSSRFGMNLGSDPAAVAAVSQRMLIVSDPPDHTQLKRVLARSFAADRMPMFEALVGDVVNDVLAEAVDRCADGATVDFVDIAKAVPNRVVCAFMGLDRVDWASVGHTVTEAFEAEDEAVRTAAHAEIFLLFADMLGRRRKNPGTDFISELATASRGTGAPGRHRPLTDEEIIFNCNGVLAGGNETTRYSAAGGLLALIQNPAQWAQLRAGGPALVPTAVEEILRWTVPGIHALRTVTRPTRIHDVPLDTGDRVTLWNVSANRDESVFTDPDEFRVTRSPNRHLSFGQGRHQCLGARLARLELAVLFRGIIERFAGFDQAGDPVWNSSNFTWGLRSLPVTLTPIPAGHLSSRKAPSHG
ncbi:MAG: cytochrome P450 [Actinobacteria bacterium]|nr:cytochrome P450 [Actinomycetota bacterium]